MQVKFGDLPLNAQEMLTRHLRVDFSHCSFKAPRWFAAWALNERDHVIGIFAVEFQTWFEGKVTVLVLDPRCCSRRVLRAIFTALFSKAKRLTAEVEPDNVRSLRQVQRLGFHREGWHPLGLEGVRDTIVFGMLKDECPWLRSYVPPSLSSLDLGSVRRREPVFPADSAATPWVRSDRQHLSNSKLHHLVALAVLIVGMAGTFSSVFFTSFPTEMLRADAAWRGAAMGSVFLVGSRSGPSGRTVHQLADNTMHLTAGAFPTHLWVAVLVEGEWPEQAFVSSVEDSGSEKLYGGHVYNSGEYTNIGALAFAYAAVNPYKIRSQSYG